MTGLYPHTSGCVENNVPLPANARCLPELDGFSEYATAYMGKWHLGDEVFAQHGFDEWVSIEDMYHEHFGEDRPDDAHSTYYRYLIEQGCEPDIDDDGFERFSRGFCTDLPEEHSKPAFLGREASRFVREHRDEPFVLYVNFLEPHSPYTSPRDDQYDPDDVDFPPNFEHDGLDDQPLRDRLDRAAVQAGPRFPGTDEPPTRADWRELVARYWGLASLVDTHAGRILDTLDDCGLAGETLTVYTSDHGAMMGSHQHPDKKTMYDEAARIPLIVRFPTDSAISGSIGDESTRNGSARDDTTAGERVSAPISQIDLVPTLLDAMGNPVPDHLQGHSLVPFLDGETETLPEEYVVIEGNGGNAGALTARVGSPGSRQKLPEAVVEAGEHLADEREQLRALTEPVRAVVTPENDELVCYRSGDRRLFDLDDDPFEIEDLADDPAQEDRVRKIESRLFEWQVRTGDPVVLF